MRRILLSVLLAAGMAGRLFAQTNIVNDASQLELSGHFKEAAAVLQSAIESGKASPTELKTLKFELDRLDRIKQDYSLTRDDLFEQLKLAVKDVSREEFNQWASQGWFDQRDIDGKTYFFNSSPSNLFFRHPELNPRRIDPEDVNWLANKRLEVIRSIKKASEAAKSPYVLPMTFRVHMTVTADSDVAPAGETIRAWLPIPREYPFQTGFKLLSSSPAPKSIDAADSPIRSIYFEQPAQAGKETEYTIDYEYTTRGVHFDLQPEKIQPYAPNDEAVKKYTGEAPHVVFTPEIKALSAKIVGNETNPMLKAKKIYDWLSDNLQYSYSLEYSTMRNISDYTRSHCYGDCGQQALLFITLCRYNGVPARWQAGWNLFPKATSNHDWAEMYFAPYGWMPVDPYVGNYAMRYATTLTREQRIEIRDFYFGGLDQYRMAANSDHNQPLNPTKDSMRSDDVDFQRGELEHNGTNIYLDKFSWKLNYKVEPSPSLP
jgi:transglutaminase-like putative cysteine protease